VLLEIAHVDDAHDPRYLVLADGSYELGGGRGDILLADSTVSPRHARLTLYNGTITIEDLNTTHGTFVDDERVFGPTRVDLSQRVRIGETILKLTLGEHVPKRNRNETRGPSKTEDGFLAALAANPADDGTREVYADWLEAEGMPVTAYYVRLELSGEPVEVTKDEMLARAVRITKPEWRAAICRGPIVGCPRRDCPRYWHLLSPGEQVRTCETCRSRVSYSSGEITTDKVVADAAVRRR
jgi:uncharacterized protein (TIGR02996 family)